MKIVVIGGTGRFREHFAWSRNFVAVVGVWINVARTGRRRLVKHVEE